MMIITPWPIRTLYPIHGLIAYYYTGKCINFKIIMILNKIFVMTYWWWWCYVVFRT